MSATPLDHQYPQGKPASPTCRWCDGDRVTNGVGVTCVVCDRVEPRG